MTLNCVHETDTVTLHSSFLKIVNSSITLNNDGTVLRLVDIVRDIEHETISLKFDSSLKKGSSYVLDIPEYSGQINDENQKGLFQTYEYIGRSNR